MRLDRLPIPSKGVSEFYKEKLYAVNISLLVEMWEWKIKAPSYFAAGRTERHGNSFSSRKVSGESWPLLYPLHKAAYDDNVTEIKCVSSAFFQFFNLN